MYVFVQECEWEFGARVQGQQQNLKEITKTIVPTPFQQKSWTIVCILLLPQEKF